MKKLFACPCCGEETLEVVGRYDLCEVCDWEDDPIQGEDPDFEGGANAESLNQARQRFQQEKMTKKLMRLCEALPFSALITAAFRLRFNSGFVLKWEVSVSPCLSARSAGTKTSVGEYQCSDEVVGLAFFFPVVAHLRIP